MGTSIPSKKEKAIVCLECIAKCESYRRTGRPAYAPQKSHKVNRQYKYSAGLSHLYAYCVHYDISNDSRFNGSIDYSTPDTFF